MGFWNRLLGLSGAEQIVDSRATGTATPRRRLSGDSDATVDLGCDPREAAQVLYVALDRAADLGMVPRREITVDDIDFDFYGGVDGFRTEAMTALLRLDDEDGRPLFSRVVIFDPECVESNDTYAHLLGQISEAAGTRDRFARIHCDLHFGPGFADNPIGELSYLRGGDPVHLDIAVEGDWVDPEVARQLFEDATPDGHRWVATGDYAIHTWVEDKHADALARIFADEDAAAETRLVGGLHHHRHAGTDKDTKDDTHA